MKINKSAIGRDLPVWADLLRWLVGAGVWWWTLLVVLILGVTVVLMLEDVVVVWLVPFVFAMFSAFASASYDRLKIIDFS